MSEPVEQLTATDPAELAETVQEVAHLYGFLASLYRAELSSEQLHALRSPPMAAVLKAVGITLEGPFWERPEAPVVEELAVEFTALFLGPGGHISPHESVQTEQQGGYWGEATTAVRDFIRAAEIEFQSGYHGIPDHIAVELEFLAELTRQESVAWRRVDPQGAANSLAYQQDFLDQHLGRWVQRFCTRVAETAELPFYGDLARVTAAFVGSEVDAVAERSELATLMAQPAPTSAATTSPEPPRAPPR